MGNQPIYQAAAERLGQVMAQQGLNLVYGGGGVGLMGVVARTVLAGGGNVASVKCIAPDGHTADAVCREAIDSGFNRPRLGGDGVNTEFGRINNGLRHDSLVEVWVMDGAFRLETAQIITRGKGNDHLSNVKGKLIRSNR
jgi:hypothetical protein